MKIDQIQKTRPFFQSAHQADSKNAKIFEKSSFFENICLRKLAWVHRPSDIFCSKSCIWCVCDCTWVLKKSFDSFENLKILGPKIESAETYLSPNIPENIHLFSELPWPGESPGNLKPTQNGPDQKL